MTMQTHAKGSKSIYFHRMDIGSTFTCNWYAIIGPRKYRTSQQPGTTGYVMYIVRFDLHYQDVMTADNWLCHTCHTGEGPSHGSLIWNENKNIPDFMTVYLICDICYHYESYESSSRFNVLPINGVFKLPIEWVFLCWERNNNSVKDYVQLCPQSAPRFNEKLKMEDNIQKLEFCFAKPSSLWNAKHLPPNACYGQEPDEYICSFCMNFAWNNSYGSSGPVFRAIAYILWAVV